MQYRRLNTCLFAVILGIASGLGGCESVQELPQPREEQPVVLQDKNPLAQLLAYFDMVVHMSAKEAQREYLSQYKQMISGICNEQRLQTAMLLTNPALNTAKKNRVSTILQPCIENPGEQGLEGMHLARILRLQLVEKQRLKLTRHKLVTTNGKLKALNERFKVLNKKLDELKSIEQSIRERE